MTHLYTIYTNWNHILKFNFHFRITIVWFEREASLVGHVMSNKHIIFSTQIYSFRRGKEDTILLVYFFSLMHKIERKHIISLLIRLKTFYALYYIN